MKAFEQVEANRVAGSLHPLDNSVSNAAARINSCAEELAGFSWDWRLMMHTVLLGMITVVITGGLVRCTFFGDRIDEAKRYEVYGRKVEANIEKYGPKDQEKLSNGSAAGRDFQPEGAGKRCRGEVSPSHQASGGKSPAALHSPLC